MSERFEKRVQACFIKALAGLTNQAWQSDHARDPEVVFVCGPVGVAACRLDAAALGVKMRWDVVLMEFVPDRVSEGPINIVVIQARDGAVRIWGECSLIADGTGPCTIVSAEDGLRVMFDGVGLQFTTGESRAASAQSLADGHRLLKAETTRILLGGRSVN